jgi:hypothetical protein
MFFTLLLFKGVPKVLKMQDKNVSMFSHLFVRYPGIFHKVCIGFIQKRLQCKTELSHLCKGTIGKNYIWLNRKTITKL